MLKPNIPANDAEREILHANYRKAATALGEAVRAVYGTIPQAKLYYHRADKDYDSCPVDRMAEATRRFVAQVRTLEKIQRQLTTIADYLKAPPD